MKFSSFSTIILVTISSILFIPQIQCTIPMPSLVDQICRKTPHYHLCVMTLNSQPSSHRLTSSADIAGFVRITLGVLESKAPAVLDQIQKVYTQTNYPPLKIARNICVTSYTKISKEILPQAKNCLHKGDYDGVKHSVYVIGNLAASCEKRCNGTTTSSGSPLRDSNRYVQNMCAITVSIVTKVALAKHQTLT